MEQNSTDDVDQSISIRDLFSKEIITNIFEMMSAPWYKARNTKIGKSMWFATTIFDKKKKEIFKKQHNFTTEYSFNR